MMTLHLAVEGALGISSYVPIEKITISVDDAPWEKAAASAVTQFAKLRKFKKTDFKPTDDHKIVAQANAWGYEEPWINGDGYTIFVGQDEPNECPDPVYAYWIPEKERMRMLEKRMPYPTKAMNKLIDACSTLIQDDGLASKETVDLFMKAYGRSISVLNDLLNAVTGECDIVMRYADKLRECGLIKEVGNNEGDEKDEKDGEEIESVEVVAAEEA